MINKIWLIYLKSAAHLYFSTTNFCCSHRIPDNTVRELSSNSLDILRTRIECIKLRYFHYMYNFDKPRRAIFRRCCKPFLCTGTIFHWSPLRNEVSLKNRDCRSAKASDGRILETDINLLIYVSNLTIFTYQHKWDSKDFSNEVIYRDSPNDYNFLGNNQRFRYCMCKMCIN